MKITVSWRFISFFTVLIVSCASQFGPVEATDGKKIPTPTLQGEELLSLVNKNCDTGPIRKPKYGRAASQQMISFGWHQVAKGEGEQAANSFLAALFIGPERPDAYWGLGVASHIAKFPLKTIKSCFDRAQSSLPNEAALFSDFGRILEERNILQEAIAAFEKALAIDRDHLQAHIGLVRSYQKIGNTGKSRVHIQRIRELKKQSKN